MNCHIPVYLAPKNCKKHFSSRMLHNFIPRFICPSVGWTVGWLVGQLVGYKNSQCLLTSFLLNIEPKIRIYKKYKPFRKIFSNWFKRKRETLLSTPELEKSQNVFRFFLPTSLCLKELLGPHFFPSQNQIVGLGSYPSYRVTYPQVKARAE